MKPVARTMNKKHGCVVFADDSVEKGPLIYVSGMAVDGDGAPHCYHPDNKGLDDNGNAWDKDRKKWVGVAVDKAGQPLVQGPDSEAPGYWLTTTALTDKNHPATNSRHYINSERYPYFAFASTLKDASGDQDIGRLHLGVNLGDYGVIYHFKKEKLTGAFFADVGPSYKLGEASIRAAQALGIPSSPKNGGEDYPRVVFVVFPGSNDGNDWPRDPEAISAKALALFEEWGGLETLKPLIDSLKAQSFEPGREEPASDLPTAAERNGEKEPVIVDL